MDALPVELLLAIAGHLNATSTFHLLLCSRHYYDSPLLELLYETAIYEAQCRPRLDYSPWIGDLGGPLAAEPDWPLHWICSRGFTQPLQRVLTLRQRYARAHDRIDLNGRDDNSCSAAYFAAAQGHADVVQLLLASVELDAFNTDMAQRHYSNRTLLSVAAGSGRVEVVRLLLDAWKRWAAAEEAAVAAKGEPHTLAGYRMYHRLIDRDVPDNGGLAPIVHASKNGHAAVVQLLLEQGDGTDRYGYAVTEDGHWSHESFFSVSPVLEAVAGDHVDVVRVLLAHGTADVPLRVRMGRTPLLVAAERGQAEIVRLLVESGAADVNAVDVHGRTALMTAVRTGPITAVQALLAHGGIDWGLEDSSGRTVVQWARPHKEILALVKAAKAADQAAQ